ncbi:hypothetical protein LEP1GSC062_0443 [Leptospira alexanderi serovar Manhao 3 str. L 60]|uniref:Uncharacterized protein n=1 Tax=Leptospira alexanderi serovar Manhao 3 str. L 60 TaxID=1049759 RepID=V6I9L6_9LEPT|nr:hypothetical protein LEP1GSC062_0443 [Leptospira alexanderi serovar Manhao 3 str. L 60]
MFFGLDTFKKRIFSKTFLDLSIRFYKISSAKVCFESVDTYSSESGQSFWDIKNSSYRFSKFEDVLKNLLQKALEACTKLL